MLEEKKQEFFSPLLIPEPIMRDVVGQALAYLQLSKRTWKIYGDLEVSHLESDEWRKSLAFQNLQNYLGGIELCLASIFRVGKGKRLKPHRDYRQFALNFPLQGDFSLAPLTWYKLINPYGEARIIEDKIACERREHEAFKAEIPYFQESECIPLAVYASDWPILLNTQELHGVDNSRGQTDRLVLSLSGQRNESYLSARARISVLPDIINAGY